MLQIAICDDEVTNILKVKELAELFFRTHCVEIRIETYKSSDNLLYDMQDGQYFDLFLLDIEMPEVSGMDLAKTIYRNIPSARIIFITSHLEYAIEAYEFSVFRYIPKKLLDDKLLIALEDFYKLYCLERDEYYVIQVKNRIEKVHIAPPIYIVYFIFSQWNVAICRKIKLYNSYLDMRKRRTQGQQAAASGAFLWAFLRI